MNQASGIGKREPEALSISQIKTIATRVFSTHKEILIAYLYGSQVNGIPTQFSDIDVGVVLDKEFKPPSLFPEKLQLELEDHYPVKNARFDIRILNQASPRFLNQAVRHGKRIYSKDSFFTAEYEIFVTRQYLDIKPLLDFFDRQYIARSLEGADLE